MPKVSVICPVLNEVDFIGYSVMAAMPYVEEFVYAVSPKSTDGTIELLRHIAKKYGHLGGKVRLLIQSKYDFNPHDEKAYNQSFNDCIEQARGDACWFLHPDMVITKWNDLKSDALAWTTKITSYAGDFNTQIVRGRCSEWKNIHAKKFGLHYFGGYGSTNEDFYHSQITGNTHKHYGTEFSKYPFAVEKSGIELNHYCELKGYKRRFEKMKLCLKTQNPTFNDAYIEELAANHPRVTLEPSGSQFGQFEFAPSKTPIPDVFTLYKAEFDAFKKQEVSV